MALEWFKPRGYRHLDRPVNEKFANRVECSKFVAEHAFSPLIYFEQLSKRIKFCKEEKRRKVVFKNRPIMFASHRDSCILSYYASILNQKLNQFYAGADLSNHVIAYRKLNRANYDFVRDAQKFATNMSPVVFLAFDVTKFFDSLDHRILKSNLKTVLEVSELERDWYQIYRFVTNYRYVKLDDLRDHEIFGERFGSKTRSPIATVAELKKHRIRINKQDSGKGIPQGHHH